MERRQLLCHSVLVDHEIVGLQVGHDAIVLVGDDRIDHYFSCMNFDGVCCGSLRRRDRLWAYRRYNREHKNGQ